MVYCGSLHDKAPLSLREEDTKFERKKSKLILSIYLSFFVFLSIALRTSLFYVIQIYICIYYICIRIYFLEPCQTEFPDLSLFNFAGDKSEEKKGGKRKIKD